MLKNIYHVLKKRLSTIAELKEVTWDMGQGTPANKGGQFTLPAVYLRFDPIDTTTIGKHVQQGEIVFTVRTVSDCLKDGDNRILDNSPVSHLDLVTKVHQALQGFSGLLSDIPGFTALKGTPQDAVILNSITRTRISPDHQNDSRIQTEQTYQGTGKDYSAMPAYRKLEQNEKPDLETDVHLTNADVVTTIQGVV